MKFTRVFYFFGWLIFVYLYKKICIYFSIFTSHLIKNRLKKYGESISFGANLYISGERYIELGNCFSAKYGLWLEAVGSYAGITYKPSIVIGNSVCCSDFVHIAATTKVIIGDNVLIGSNVHITDHAHGVYNGSVQSDWRVPPIKRHLLSGLAVEIESNVWLGDGVIVLPGVTIGHGSIIGANSVVTCNIPSCSIAVGNPARVIKVFDDKLKEWRIV